MKTTAYSEKLRNPRWQKMRLQVLERDDWTCQWCGATDKTLVVHHLYYKRGAEPWEYPIESLLTVCDECHQERVGVDGVPSGVHNDVLDVLYRAFGVRGIAWLYLASKTCNVTDVYASDTFQNLVCFMSAYEAEEKAIRDMAVSEWEAKLKHRSAVK